MTMMIYIKKVVARNNTEKNGVTQRRNKVAQRQNIEHES
jgi:hypothetical protein